MTVTRSDVVRVARSYLGTPFHHLGRTPGLAMDCVGLPICALRELGAVAPDFDVPPYDPTPDGRTFLAQCDLYMTRVSQAEMGFGDVIVLVVDKLPQHMGVLAEHSHGGTAIIHASNARSVVPPRVIETRLMFSRAMRFVAAYRLPGVA